MAEEYAPDACVCGRRFENGGDPCTTCPLRYFVTEESAPWWDGTEVLPGDLRLSTSTMPRGTDWVDDGDNLVVTDVTDACFRCGASTHIIDLAFEARLCIDCDDLMWGEFYDTWQGDYLPFDVDEDWVPQRPVENVKSPYL